jgi:hypothetical protein
VSAKRIAWIASVLCAVSLAVSAVVVVKLVSSQRRVIDSLLVNEFLDARRTMSVLEHLETGQDLDVVRALMVDRTFVSLTRLQPNRGRLPTRYYEDLDRVVARFSAYRQRNPGEFAQKPNWWLGRFDGWVSDLQ